MIIFSGKIHVGLALIIIFVLNPSMSKESLVFTIGAVVGSLLPDCDVFPAPASFIVPAWLVMKHRTYTHSIFAMLLISILISIIKIWLGLGIAFGYGLHLIGDKISGKKKNPLPYLWWIPGRKIV